MASLASQKPMGELLGDTPEEIAWALLEWVRRVEPSEDRKFLLRAYGECLATVRDVAFGAPFDDSLSSTGSQRRLAYKMTLLVAASEGREPGQRTQGDRKWILDAYAECLATLTGKTIVVADVVEQALVEVDAVAA